MKEKWNRLNNLDLAQEETNKKNYNWPGFKTQKKENGY